MIITKGELTEVDTAKVLTGYEGLMTKDGGEILKRDDWGNRKLNFPIGKSFRGTYVNYDFVGSPANVAEMERLMRIDDNVLRHLIVRIDEEEGKIDVAARKDEIVKTEKEMKEREMAAEARRELRRKD
jgi:small subunit ribosomal protein S6